MDAKISTLHRGLLWLATIINVIFGVAYYIAPAASTKALGVYAPDPVAIRCIGGFLLGAAVGAWLAIRSGQWSEARIVTYYLITWDILNSLAMFYAILSGGGSLSLLPNAILSAIIGLGLAFVAWQRRAA